MRPLELTPSGLLGTALVFVVAAVCVRLGFWQLERRAERLDRNAAIAERLAEPPVSLGSLPTDTGGLTYRRASVEGSYDTQRTLVLAGRSLRGSPGVHVLAPLRTGDGAILVNRGWLPSRDAATVDLSAVALDTAVAVSGVLLPFPRSEGTAPEEGFRTTWFRLDGAAIRRQYPYAVAPLYLQRDSTVRSGSGSAAAADVSAPTPLPTPSLDSGPHLSYALQWFSFAVIFVVGWAALVMRRGRGPEPEPGTSPGA